MENSFLDISASCAQVLTMPGRPVGTAFLISSQRALAASASGLAADEQVILKFSHGKYSAIVEVSSEALGCSVLLIDQAVEDVIPLGYSFNVTLGDLGYFYGFPFELEGAGVFFQGHIQATNTPTGLTGKPIILLFPSYGLAPRILKGALGAPLIVGNAVVGILIGYYGADSSTANFMVFARIQDVLDLLPDEVISHLRAGPLQQSPAGDVSTPEILVTTALDEELDYLYELPLAWSELKALKDGITYRRGHLTEGIDLIATSARSMGLSATAILTAKVLKEWNPSVAAMIGICGGRKEKGLNIGDVVVANQCFHYQFGAFVDGRVVRELRVENVDPQLIDLVEHLARRTKVLQEMQQSLPRGFTKPNTVLQCHIGPMASADLIVKDIEKLGEAVEADRKTIAVDMESYAFMRAARLARTRWAFVVKSVSDFADAKKDDDYREYAKYTSANFFMQIAHNLVAGWS